MSVNAGIDRRTFLKILGGSLAAAGISASGLGVALGQRTENGVRVIELVKELVRKYETTHSTPGFEHVADATLFQMLRMANMVYIKHGLTAALGVIGCVFAGTRRVDSNAFTRLIRASRKDRSHDDIRPFLDALKDVFLNDDRSSLGDINPQSLDVLIGDQPVIHIENAMLVADWMGYDREEQLALDFNQAHAKWILDEYISHFGALPPFNDPNDTFTEDDDLSWLDAIEV